MKKIIKFSEFPYEQSYVVNSVRTLVLLLGVRSHMINGLGQQ